MGPLSVQFLPRMFPPADAAEMAFLPEVLPCSRGVKSGGFRPLPQTGRSIHKCQREVAFPCHVATAVRGSRPSSKGSFGKQKSSQGVPAGSLHQMISKLILVLITVLMEGVPGSALSEEAACFVSSVPGLR